MYPTSRSVIRTDNQGIAYGTSFLGLGCAREIVCHNYVIYDSMEENSENVCAAISIGYVEL